MRPEVHTNPGNMSLFRTNAKRVPPVEAEPFSNLADYFSQGLQLVAAARRRNNALKMDPPLPSSFGFSKPELLVLQGYAMGKTPEKIQATLDRLNQKDPSAKIPREATIRTRINNTVERTGRGTHCASLTQVALAESVHEGTLIVPIPKAIDPLYVGRRTDGLSLIANLGEPVDVLKALGARTLGERARIWEEVVRGVGAKSKDQAYAITAALFART